MSKFFCFKRNSAQIGPFAAKQKILDMLLVVAVPKLQRRHPRLRLKQPRKILRIFKAQRKCQLTHRLIGIQQKVLRLFENSSEVIRFPSNPRSGLPRSTVPPEH